MRTRRDFLTPAIVIFGVVIVILALWVVICDAQTHTMPGSNVVPSGGTLTIQSGGSIIASPGSTVTGFGSGGGSGTVTDFSAGDLSPLFTTSEATTTTTPALTFSLSTAAANTVFGNATSSSAVPTFSSSPRFTAIGNLTSNGFVKVSGSVGTLSVDTATYQPADADLDTWATLTPSANFQTMVPHTFAQMKTDLALVIGTNVQAWDTDLDVWAGKTPYAGTVVVTTGKTFTDTNNLTLSGTDGSTLNIGGGGTLGTAAYTASSAYEVPLTFSTGLTRSTNTVTVNTSQNIATLSNLTTNGFVKTGGAVGTLSVDTATYQGTLTNSAGLRGALSDENGTGVALFNAATSPDFTTGVTIGSVAVPTISSTSTLTNKRVNPRVTSIASNATWSPSADTDDTYEITAQAAAVTVISNPAGTPVDGQSLIIRFKDDGTARALTWSGSQWEAGPGMTLPTSTIVGNHDYAGFKWNSTTSKWTMVACTQLSGSTDDTAYASSWNAVTATAPSKNAVYDELHKIDSADDGTIVNAGTGFRIAGAASNNYELTGNGTNFVAKASDIPNGSSAQQTGFSSNTYLAGSVITINAGDFKVGSTYRCMFDMAKTTAGTAAPVITIYIGTLGSTSDTAAQTISFAAATGVADTGMFEVWVNFRAVGASATISSVGRCVHNLAATGLTSTGASGSGTVSNSTSSTFNSTAMTKIGVAFNGGASYVGTNNLVQAYYSNP